MDLKDDDVERSNWYEGAVLPTASKDGEQSQGIGAFVTIFLEASPQVDPLRFRCLAVVGLAR